MFGGKRAPETRLDCMGARDAFLKLAPPLASPILKVQDYGIQSADFHRSFEISDGISRFQSGFRDFSRDFRISVEISGFQSGFRDFSRDFGISVGISKISEISAEGVRDFQELRTPRVSLPAVIEVS